MAKIFLFLVIALIAYVALRWRRTGDLHSGAEPPERSASGEAVVACSRCGMHVPLSESIEVAGKRYCSEEHSRLG